MCSVCNAALALLCSLAMLGVARAADLRVCADPNNLPYSNSDEQGFENKLAEVVARDLGRTLQYSWSPQRGDFLRKTLDTGACDVVMGIPSGIEEAHTTRPYYRSSYAFVWRRDRHLSIHSFDDASLKNMRIGIHVLQHEDATAPPAQALIDRGLMHNIAWYKLFPDFSRSNPPAALIEAVERGDIDMAIAWGPLAVTSQRSLLCRSR